MPIAGTIIARRTLGQAKATNREWALYYARADRARLRYGDPFQVLIERARRRDRLMRAAFAVVAIVALVALFWFAFGMAGDLSGA